MQEINEMNWQMFAIEFIQGKPEIKVHPLPDIESIQIHAKVKETCNNKYSEKFLYLETIGVKSNFYSMVNINI